MGWDHVEKVEKHESQKDYKQGFGGEFGVQSDRVDKSAVGWDHVESLNKHESQKGDISLSSVAIKKLIIMHVYRLCLWIRWEVRSAD